MSNSLPTTDETLAEAPCPLVSLLLKIITSSTAYPVPPVSIPTELTVPTDEKVTSEVCFLILLELIRYLYPLLLFRIPYGVVFLRTPSEVISNTS